MPDSLHERDILIWSEQQAERLRRLSRGESVGGIDRENVAEEIESVGHGMLHEVKDHLARLITCLLRVSAYPDVSDVRCLREQCHQWQWEAELRFSPSMADRINVEGLYANAVEICRAGDKAMWVSLANPLTPEQHLANDLAIGVRLSANLGSSIHGTGN